MFKKFPLFRRWALNGIVKIWKEMDSTKKLLNAFQFLGFILDSVFFPDFDISMSFNAHLLNGFRVA